MNVTQSRYYFSKVSTSYQFIHEQASTYFSDKFAPNNDVSDVTWEATHVISTQLLFLFIMVNSLPSAMVLFYGIMCLPVSRTYTDWMFLNNVVSLNCVMSPCAVYCFYTLMYIMFLFHFMFFRTSRQNIFLLIEISSINIFNSNPKIQLPSW